MSTFIVKRQHWPSAADSYALGRSASQIGNSTSFRPQISFLWRLVCTTCATHTATDPHTHSISFTSISSALHLRKSHACNAYVLHHGFQHLSSHGNWTKNSLPEGMSRPECFEMWKFWFVDCVIRMARRTCQADTPLMLATWLIDLLTSWLMV